MPQHLGHNLPDRTGARYCIDLVCMAGGDSSAAAVARPPPPPPVAPLASSGAIKTYWGAGCYWHTQYDMYLVETDPAGPFARTDVDITAHVGYAGGCELMTTRVDQCDAIENDYSTR